MPRLADEQLTDCVTASPHVTTTLTEAVWRTRVKEGGWFVKKRLTGTPSAGRGHTQATFLVNNDAGIWGRLEGCSGTGSSFVISVRVRGVDGYAQGGGTGALSVADLGDGVQGNADGKLKIVTASGFGLVFGGDQANLRLSWDGINN